LSKEKQKEEEEGEEEEEEGRTLRVVIEKTRIERDPNFSAFNTFLFREFTDLENTKAGTILQLDLFKDLFEGVAYTEGEERRRGGGEEEQGGEEDSKEEEKRNGEKRSGRKKHTSNREKGQTVNRVRQRLRIPSRPRSRYGRYRSPCDGS
jgi:hypothetical protein